VNLKWTGSHPDLLKLYFKHYSRGNKDREYFRIIALKMNYDWLMGCVLMLFQPLILYIYSFEWNEKKKNGNEIGRDLFQRTNALFRREWKSKYYSLSGFPAMLPTLESSSSLMQHWYILSLQEPTRNWRLAGILRALCQRTSEFNWGYPERSMGFGFRASKNMRYKKTVNIFDTVILTIDGLLMLKLGRNLYLNKRKVDAVRVRRSRNQNVRQGSL
jgi:hypothetical protein